MPNNTSWPFRYDLLQRYRLIEIIALWEGRLNAQHLQTYFGIGRQQASKDINNYLSEVGLGNLIYNRSLKGYEPSDTFAPKLTQGVVDEYLQLVHRNGDLATTFEQLPLGLEYSHTLPLPTFKVRPEILRPIIQACQKHQRLEVDYRSVNAPDKSGRIIVPYAIVHSGVRWHVRAWCEKNEGFRDFVLTRFYDIPEVVGPATVNPNDVSWETRVNISFMPDPRLRIEQQAVVANDFGMTENRLVVTVRAALIPYLLQMMRVDVHKIEGDPVAQQIVIENFDAIKQWLFR